MNVVRLVRHALAVVFGLAVILSAGAGVARGATTLTLDPDTATPGTKVTILNACLGVTDTPTDEMRVAFVSSSTPDLDPTDPSVVKSVARALRGGYVVVVPELAPGSYEVRLECLPGDWRTNTAEGGAQPLTVLTGAPATSTDQVGGHPGGKDPFVLLALLGLGLSAAVAMDRGLGKRRSAMR